VTAYSQDYTLEVELADMPRGWVLFAIGSEQPCMAPPPVANAIKRMREAIKLVTFACDVLHHENYEYHQLGEPCPVERRINDLLQQSTDFSTKETP